MVTNPPAKQETQVWSLGQEDPLEKEMATTLVFFANKGSSSQSYGFSSSDVWRWVLDHKEGWALKN